MNDYGIKVLVIKTNEYGYITRRLNAQAYEIWLESGVEVVLDKDEFVELKKGEKDE